MQFIHQRIVAALEKIEEIRLYYYLGHSMGLNNDSIKKRNLNNIFGLFQKNSFFMSLVLFASIIETNKYSSTLRYNIKSILSDLPEPRNWQPLYDWLREQGREKSAQKIQIKNTTNRKIDLLRITFYELHHSKFNNVTILVRNYRNALVHSGIDHNIQENLLPQDVHKVVDWLECFLKHLYKAYYLIDINYNMQNHVYVTQLDSLIEIISD